MFNESTRQSTREMEHLIELNPAPELYGLSFNSDKVISEQIAMLTKSITGAKDKYGFKHPINILLVGMTQGGKSSLINSFFYSLKGEIDESAYSNTQASRTAVAGSTTFQKYELEPWLQIWDSPGWQGPEDVNEKDPTLGEISKFWNFYRVDQICTELVLKHNVKISKLDKVGNMPLENQIHSVICVWNPFESGNFFKLKRKTSFIKFIKGK